MQAETALSLSISIDVPALSRGVAFFREAFGFEVVAEPYPGVALMRAGEAEICLLEKRAGTKPSPNTEEKRHYERHWTPVHFDLHVADLDAAVARAVAAGAIQEQRFDHPGHGGAAFCSDPFGHGFCILGKPAKAQKKPAPKPKATEKAKPARRARSTQKERAVRQ